LSSSGETIRVTAVAASSELGGTERVLLDFAARAFEHDIMLRVITPRPGPLLNILNDIGVPAEVVPAPPSLLRGSQRLTALWSAPGAMVGLRTWARRLAGHPFVRDTDLWYGVSFKAYLAFPKGASTPVVWHLHEFPPALTGTAWKLLARRRPDALIANSDAVARAWGAPAPGARRARAAPPIIAIPNGVDLDRFRPRERSGWIARALGIAPTTRIIGMPAVLASWKGQLAVVDAFTRIRDRFPDVHLVFVGGSIYDTVAERSFEGRLRTVIQRESRVHLVPFQPKIELAYPEFDLAVHYSTRAEAFGRVIIEAMASAVPVLAAAEGGPVEIVTEGGWLVEPRAPGALANAMVSALMLPPDHLRQIGHWGRIRMEDHYSARRFARDVSRVLRATTSGVPAGPA